MNGWYENSTISHIEKSKNKITGAAISGNRIEGKEIAETKASGETADPRNRGFPLTTDNYPDAYGSGNNGTSEKSLATGHPKNPVSPDNIVTNNPKQAGKNSKKSINDFIAEYNQKNNTNLPLCVESYNYLRAKGENFGYADNGGWARLQDTTNANRTMQESLGIKMLDGSDLGKEGCKVITDTKIESEIIGERIDMDNLNKKATNGFLDLQATVDDINKRLEEIGDTRRAVGKRYEGKDVNRALLDTISSSEDTIYVTGMANGVAGHTHWLELDRYFTNKYGETQFQYYPSSDYDVSNDRLYLLGPKLFNRSSETGTDTIDNNIFSISVIETITLTNQF